MARFTVPRMLQQKVLLIGVMLALLMRGVIIAIGAAVVDRFVWVFYLFGAFLIYTAIALVRQHGDEDDFKENVLIRWGRRIPPMSAQYDGARLTTYAEPGVRAGNRSGRRIFTPMLIVMIAIGTTDLIFALDSIPAIFGLTSQSYLVFTANVFALMDCASCTSCSAGYSTGSFTCHTGSRPSSGSSASNWSSTRCTAITCPSSTAASPSNGHHTWRSGYRWP